MRSVSLPFLLSSPGASGNTIGQVPGLLSREAPNTCPALSFSLLPHGLCFHHPGCARHSSFLLSTKSQPWKAHFPACTQSSWGSLGYHTGPRVLLMLPLSVSVVSPWCSWCLFVPHSPDTPRVVTGQHLLPLVAEDQALPGEVVVTSVSDVWAQRPGDLMVRGSDPKCLSPCLCHSRMLGDLAQLLILWA